MNKKSRILESWIMVERLSEGDINGKSVVTLNQLEDENYYALFMMEMQKKNVHRKQEGGIVVYFDIFSFDEVIKFLKEKYQLSLTGQEIWVGNKFSFALYFDRELRIDSEKTFLTASYYIRKYREIPKEGDLLTFEQDNRKEYDELFDCSEGADYEECFNEAIKRILTKNNILAKNCRMKALPNLEADAVNLHSFFVEDLERAKTIRTDILDDYILGEPGGRVDLDSRTASDKFNGEMLYKILEPQNYPVARFPSNPNYSLSFMQQVAVNLAIGFDDKKIRSVNGPPGTGKTTLLRDIFAQLVVEQAYEICKLGEKYISGSEETKYWSNASIGIMPEKMAEKGIMVASSNNGAVQNIVNELPLCSEISDEFLESIFQADYFTELANSKLEAEWVKDEDGKAYIKLSRTKKEGDENFWGLFSLEGGKKQNMNYVITALRHVVDYLKNEYQSDKTVYQEFQTQYTRVCAYKALRQMVSKVIEKRQLLLIELTNKGEAYAKEKIEKNLVKERDSIGLSEGIKTKQNEIKDLEASHREQLDKLGKIHDDKDAVNQCIEALRLQKPGWFCWGEQRKEYRKQKKNYSDQLQRVIREEHSIKTANSEIETKIWRLNDEIENSRIKIAENEELFAQWIHEKEREIARLEGQIEELTESIKLDDGTALDFTLDYESLQLSNPWFDIEYRRLQSELFIAALSVRKQFLYENVKNIWAAIVIWGKQEEYLEEGQKIVISAAWDWINMVIPVISSTFASISRMCNYLDEGSIGHLFIDEAGQALPQASVGAIFRSKNVMAVGDPAQIKPVLTLDPSILSMFRKHYGVSQRYLSESASTQTLIDEISQYGFYKDDSEEEWIGIPLWVHRRCKSPMFDIANKISYGGNMVQGVKEEGASEWFHIGGIAEDKYVKKQGIFLKEKIDEMSKENTDICDKEKEDVIYVITPFRNVAHQLSCELKEIDFTRYDEHGKPTNVGTVHTFQGKEAPIVFLVLGADEKSRGAANWAMGTENPNIMNVAVTRAKEEFYIIGDQELYLKIKSDVINSTCEIISRFNSDH